MILSEYLIHDNGDGARHDFLEFLLHIIHVGRYMLIIMVITRTEIVETGIAILINAAYQKVKVVIGISFFY